MLITTDETTSLPTSPQSAAGVIKTILVAYQPSTLSYQKLLVDAGGNFSTVGGGGGSGGAVTSVDGGLVTVGNTADTAWISGAGTLVAILKKIAGGLAVTGTFWQATQPVSGTFFPATQPVSATALPLPAGASTEAMLALIKAKTDNLDVALSTRAVTGLTDAQLRATAIPVVASRGAASANDWRIDLRRGQTILFAVIDVAASGDNTIVAASSGLKVKVLQYTLVADGAVACRWKSGASNLSGAMAFASNGGIATPIATPGGGHLLETAVNTALILNLSAAIGARGHISYILEA